MGKLERSGIPLSLVAGLIVGTYVTHGECYMDDPKDYSRDFLAVGGTFQGESWKRIGFTRQILDALPNPLHLCDSSWDLILRLPEKIII